MAKANRTADFGCLIKYGTDKNPAQYQQSKRKNMTETDNGEQKI